MNYFFELINRHGYGFYIFVAYFSVFICLSLPILSAWWRFRQYLKKQHHIKKVKKYDEQPA